MVPDGETHAVSSAAAVTIPISIPGENNGSQSPIASGKASSSNSNHPSRFIPPPPLLRCHYVPFIVFSDQSSLFIVTLFLGFLVPSVR